MAHARSLALGLLFLVSGFAALIYQIVWQRLLFTALGVNIESVTLVVAVFMFGLGVGSLVGGHLSRRYPNRLLHLFVAFETIIGMFGVASVPLIKATTALVLGAPAFTIGLTIYGLLCVPTVFMGATLPMLVTYLYPRIGSVGRAVSALYFANTLGSALASFATVDVLFVRVGLQASVGIAAGLNFAVAALSLPYVRWARAGTQAKSPMLDAALPIPDRDGPRVSFATILLLAAASGYVALSQEILWTRVIGFATGDRADIFGHVLGCVLLGVAVGSLAAGVWARRGHDASLRAVPLLFAVSSALYYVSLPIGARLVAYSPDFGLSACYGLLVLVACSTGAVFPSLCHFAIRSPKAVGLSVSRIYFANILGSTAGPLLTGLVLSQWLTLEHNTLALAIVGTALALWAAYAGALRGSARSAFSLALAAAMAAAVFTHERTYSQLLERLYYKDLYGYRRSFSRVVQNRSGIVSVIPDEPDTLLGGGIYDGRFNTDPVQDANAIRRAYMVAGLHRDPQDVLEVGLGSGSWTRAILDSDLVQRLTVVEINPAYSSLLRFYPDVANVLDDPRVTLVVDDGRRWIRRHPDARFDVIVMNTTFHWRNMITNLLSADFLRMCKSHLKPGGVIYYNSTGSPHVFYTAARVFPHVVQYLNFVAGSDALFDITREERRANLLRFHRGERTIFDERRIDSAEALDRMSQETLLDLGERLRARSDLWLITDDNMATEFKTRLGGQATSLR